MQLWQILIVYAAGMFGILYVITILPGKRKNKQVRAMHDSVVPGDVITTAGGIIATVKEREGDAVTLLIDENTGTTMKVVIYAVQSIVEKAGETKEQ